MDKINILNKQGMLTDAERKMSLVRSFNYVTFETNMDLSDPISVVAFGGRKQLSITQYSNDLASFISWWSYFVMKDLNGFRGFGGLKFELDFELV